jgi:hypothetical protein
MRKGTDTGGCDGRRLSKLSGLSEFIAFQVGLQYFTPEEFREKGLHHWRNYKLLKMSRNKGFM